MSENIGPSDGSKEQTKENIMKEEWEEIRDQQKETWNKFSPGWKKWDDLTMDSLKPMGDEIIRLLHPKNDDLVLDVAAGTGEPGLTIASRLKGWESHPNGPVG